MRPLALLLVIAFPVFAAPRVLLLWDTKSAQTTELTKALEGGGLEVRLSDTDSAHFNGENPTLTNFDVVIHMNGTTWMTTLSHELAAARLHRRTRVPSLRFA